MPEQWQYHSLCPLHPPTFSPSLELEYYLIPLRGKGRHALHGWLPRAAVRHRPTSANQTSILLSEWRCQQIRVWLGQTSNQPRVCRSDFGCSRWCRLSRNLTQLLYVSLWILDHVGGVYIRCALCHCFWSCQVQLSALGVFLPYSNFFSQSREWSKVFVEFLSL